MGKRSQPRSDVWGTSSVSIVLDTTVGADNVTISKAIIGGDIWGRAPTRGGVYPGTCRIKKVAVNIRTGASYATQGTMAYLWANDTDLFPTATFVTSLQDAIRKTNNRDGTNPRGMLCSVNRFPHDSKNHVLANDNGNVRWRNTYSGDYGRTSNVGTFSAVFPTGVQPIVTLEILCSWHGVDNTGATSTTPTAARNQIYTPDNLNLAFLQSAFTLLAVEFAYKAFSDPKVIKWSKALQIVFLKPDEEGELSPVKVCVVKDISSLTFSPNFSFMFPPVFEDGTMASKPARWTQAPISNPMLDEDEVWYAHSDVFETDLPDLDMSSVYTRVTTLTPNDRTPSEFLSAGYFGSAAINVNGTAKTALEPQTPTFIRMLQIDEAIAEVREKFFSTDLGDFLLSLSTDLRTHVRTIGVGLDDHIYQSHTPKGSKVLRINNAIISFFEDHSETRHDELAGLLKNF